MTTRAAEAAYLEEHLQEWGEKGWAIFNPHGRPAGDLPVIYGFNNTTTPVGMQHGVLIAEDGTHLGDHLCSHESYMLHDLGVLEGSRPDRHEDFRVHYPDGYRMEFVGLAEAESHLGLRAALHRNEQGTPGTADTAA